MVYIDESKQTIDILKYLHDIREELQTFKQTVVGIGAVLIIVQVLSAILK